jgi:internalin A
MVRRFAGVKLSQSAYLTSDCTRLESLCLMRGIPPDLTAMTSLQRLTLYDAHQTYDWRGLSALTKLTDLTLREVHIRNVAPLQNMLDLKHLSLEVSDVSIGTLSTLTQLETLDVSNSKLLSSLDALKPLVNLTRLCVHHTDISDITALAGMTKLERLDVSYTFLWDLDALASCVQLRQIYADYTRIHTIKVLSHLTQLEILSLNHSHEQDLWSLSTVTSLTYLSLSESVYPLDLTPLSTLRHLKSLSLSKTNLTYDLEPLARLTSLTSLHASGEDAYMIPALSTLTRLKFMEIRWCTLCPSHVFQNLRNLQSLSLLADHDMSEQQKDWLLQGISTHIPRVLVDGVDVHMRMAYRY